MDLLKSQFVIQLFKITIQLSQKVCNGPFELLIVISQTVCPMKVPSIDTVHDALLAASKFLKFQFKTN